MPLTLDALEKAIRNRFRRAISLCIHASTQSQEDENAMILLLYCVNDEEIIGGIAELLAKQGVEL